MNKKPHVRHLIIVIILVITVHLLIMSPFCIDLIQLSIAQLQQQNLSQEQDQHLQPPLAQQPPAQVVLVPSTYLPKAGIPSATGQTPPINLLAQPSALGPNTAGLQSAQEMSAEPMATKPNQEVATVSQPERTEALDSEQAPAAEPIDQAISTDEPIADIRETEDDHVSALTALAMQRTRPARPQAALRELTPKERVMKRGAQSKQPTSVMAHQQSQKAKPTLADISQGFMQSVQNQKASAAQEGEGGIGQGVRIACRRYEDKVWALIEQAIRLNREHIYCDRDIEMNTSLIVTVAKDGSLVDARLSAKTGNHNMDTYLLSKPKQAGLFPPIPESLGKDTVTSQANFRISLKKGMNAMEFIMYAPHG